MYLTALMNRLQSTFRFLERVMNPTTITPDSVNALILPKVGSYGMKSFHYIGAKIWNSLPYEIQTTFSKSLFKVRCK